MKEEKKYSRNTKKFCNFFFFKNLAKGNENLVASSSNEFQFNFADTVCVCVGILYPLFMNYDHHHLL